jgi:hypothetical protein
VAAGIAAAGEAADKADALLYILQTKSNKDAP